jgi:hypothetical protein
MLEVSYLSGEIDLRADISEPDAPEDTVSLQNVMLVDICGAIIAFPCLLCIQCTKICDCCLAAAAQHKSYEVTDDASGPREVGRKTVANGKEKAKGSGALSLSTLSSALVSLISQPGRRTRGSVVPSDGPDDEDLEDQNDMKRLQALRFKNRNQAQQPEPSAPPPPEQNPPELEMPIHPPPSQKPLQSTPSQRTLQPSQSQRPLPPIASQRPSQDNEKEDDSSNTTNAPSRPPLAIDPHSPSQQEYDGLNSSSLPATNSPNEVEEDPSSASSPSKKLRTTLLAKDFKFLWSKLPVAGSFQCRLRMAPNIQKLTEHLRKQGFHIVFASSSSDTETEISICNIKESGEDEWFMARFVFTNSHFSAVMKSENSQLIESYVKRFTLAKVLKIDTSAS